MEDFVIDILPQIERKIKAIALRQTSDDAIERVYHNLLAVYSASFYLQCMGIDSDLTQSASTDGIFQTLLDTGALMLPSLGVLECRPVQTGAAAMVVPEEVWGDRLGYLAIELNIAASEARIIGFVQTVDQLQVPLEKLDSLEAFLKHLEYLGVKKNVEQSAETLNPSVNCLSQWLEGRISAGWQLVEETLEPLIGRSLQPVPGFRQATLTQNLEIPESIRYAKELTLATDTKNINVKVVIGVRPDSQTDYKILVGLYPIHEPFLVPDVQFFLLDDDEKVVLQALSKTETEFLHFSFGGSLSDKFGIKIQHKHISFEDFFEV